MSNSVQVDVIQGKLDRIMPVSLQSFMNQTEWDDLANKIDRAMAPALRLQIFIPVAMVSWFFLSAIIFGVTFAASSPASSGSLPIGPFVVVPALFVVMVIGIVVSTRQASEKVRDKTNAICRHFTEKHAGTLSFHIKQETYVHDSEHHAARCYLEIVTASYNVPMQYASVIEVAPIYDSGSASTTKDSKIVLPSAPIEPSKQLSAAERLAELEKMKHLLSKEEYQDKRRSILDSF